MHYIASRPWLLALILTLCTAIPVMVSATRVVQVPTGTLPADSLRFAAAPLSHFLHALAGVLFGILGPLQFTRVLQRRFGRLHRLLGRLFVLAGLGLGLAGFGLWFQISSIATPLLDAFRALAGTALLACLIAGLRAIRHGDIARHRAWMIRAYGIGIGSGTVALVFLPIVISTGSMPTGWQSDVIFVGWWSLNVALAEAVARRAPVPRLPPPNRATRSCKRTARMKTAYITAYGGPEVITFRNIPAPQPKAGEVQLRILAAPVTAGDVRMRSGKVPRGFGILLRLAMGWQRPRNPPGWSFCAEVAVLGSGVRQFTLGQKVFGLTGIKGGSHAEYAVIRADGPLFPLPDGLSAAEGAAFFFGGLTALDFLIDKARLQPGERVLINGATGAVGSAALQLARHIGAEVTAVASARNHALARELGATHVHDYTKGPVQGSFDVVLDVIGTLDWSGAQPLLAPGGRLLLITAGLAEMLGALLRPRRSGWRVIAGTSSEAKTNMARLIALYQAGAYRPVVSQTLPFADLAHAHALAETFHKPGNLVVEM